FQARWSVSATAEARGHASVPFAQQPRSDNGLPMAGRVEPRWFALQRVAASFSLIVVGCAERGVPSSKTAEHCRSQRAAAAPGVKSKRILDPMCFGATGDGKHDDAPAFRAALAALASTGGTVHASAGTYLLASTDPNVRRNMAWAMELCDDCTLSLGRGAVL